MFFLHKDQSFKMENQIPGFTGFSVGVNYWASHAGTRMWELFSAEEVEADFAALHNTGVNTVRIFPLWSDFQPVIAIADCSNNFREMGFPDGSKLPATGIKSYGIDPVMMARFRTVADLALKYELQLVVGPEQCLCRRSFPEEISLKIIRHGGLPKCLSAVSLMK